MTDKHIPASKLLALQRYSPNIGGDMIYSDQPQEALKWVNADDLRALIEQHKREAAEPVEYQIKILGERWTHCAKHIYDQKNPNTRALYASPQPDIVAKLVKALEDYYDRLHEHKGIATAAHEAIKIINEFKVKL